MRRREVITLFGVAAFLASSVAAAQESGRPRRIGFLGNSTAALEANLVGGFRDGLRDLGYVEGRNVTIEYRWAEGQYERLAPLIAELAASKVDVIVTAGTPAALAVGRTAPSIPLVMVAVGDPIGTGLAASLARPGGNATGLTSLAPDLQGKRLELIREMLPNVSGLAVFWNPANAYQIRDEREVRAAPDMLRIQVMPLAVQGAKELDGAFAAVLAQDADAMLVLADRVFLHNRERIVAFAAENRRPMMSAYRELAEGGGLMSFGPSYAVMHRQAARYVDKILKREKPAELPIEQPARFELVINLKRAKALGLAVPPTLLTRADEVIE
jgi:putative tryptophan/tyrosine transport system substrate-binding protein